MTENLTITKQRLLEYAWKKGMKKELLFQEMQIDGANFRGKSARSELSVDKIVRALKCHPDLSANWLLLGKGEMLRDGEWEGVGEPAFEYMRSKDRRIEELIRENQSLREENERLRVGRNDD